MNIELHIIQNFAPSCLNRDDTNTPKDCTFGGYRRARISSQCVKRSIRRYFGEAELLPKEHLAERSKRLITHVAERVAQAKKDDLSNAAEAVKAALASIKLSTDSKRADETQYLLFLGNTELENLANVISQYYEVLRPAKTTESDAPADGKKKSAKQKKSEAKEAVPPEVAKAVKAVFDGGKAADVALFGRMLADQANLNVDAACQVAHALSTNKVDMEMDFFTAVDDLKARAEEEDAGAGMLGTTEFNSSCFYRYSNINLKQLALNLGGDQDLLKDTVKAYLTASINAIPTGKQNSTAAQNPPSFVLAVVREHGLWSLTNAFENPIKPTHDRSLVQNSIFGLDQYWGKLTKVYGINGIKRKAVLNLEESAKLTVLIEDAVENLDALIATILSALPKEGQ